MQRAEVTGREFNDRPVKLRGLGEPAGAMQVDRRRERLVRTDRLSFWRRLRLAHDGSPRPGGVN